VIEIVSSFVIPAALQVLGDRYDTPEARAMLLAIGLQESRFTHRAQVKGPARGFWQFERGGGVKGVLTHATSSAPAIEALTMLRYHVPGEASMNTCARIYNVLEHNDVLAAVFARLLLWTLPGSLAGPNEHERGWDQYLSAWRPGKPHRATWNAFYTDAWDRVSKDS
jgi:hypothetical protein